MSPPMPPAEDRPEGLLEDEILEPEILDGSPGEGLAVPLSAPPARALRPEDADRLRDILDRTTPKRTEGERRKTVRYLEAWHRAQYGEPLPIPSPVEAVLAFVLGHYEGLPEAVERELVEADIKRPGVHAVATIETRVAHWSKMHTAEGLRSPASDPVVKELLSRLRRERAKRGGQRQSVAIDLAKLDRLVLACLRDVGPGAAQAERLRGLRDAALFLATWDAGGRRRSEILGLEVGDLVEDSGGLAWTLGSSKTDQEGEGLAVWIGPRASEAVRVWLAAAGITEGAVFRGVTRHGHVRPKALTGRGFAGVLEVRAEQAGLDPETVSPHGFRAGWMTEAGKRGHSLQEAMRMAGLRSVSVALRYHRAGAARHNRAAGMAG